VDGNFFSRIDPCICGKILQSRVGHRWPYGVRALHPRYQMLHTHTQRICNRYCFSASTMVARTRLSVALYILTLSCSILHYSVGLYSRGRMCFLRGRESLIVFQFHFRLYRVNFVLTSIHNVTERNTAYCYVSCWSDNLDYF